MGVGCCWRILSVKSSKLWASSNNFCRFGDLLSPLFPSAGEKSEPGEGIGTGDGSAIMFVEAEGAGSSLARGL